MIGLSPFIPPIYAIFIGLGVFFGIKAFYEKRRKAIEKEFANGVCYHCGQKLLNNACPECDETK